MPTPLTYWVVFGGCCLFASKVASQEHVILNNTYQDPELSKSVKQIIRYHGYPVESYDVMTEDGYLLEMQRIPHGKHGPVKPVGQPVIIQHGLLCSSAVWILNTPAKNLAYILADEGYDVWLTNVRGNEFGIKHVNQTPENKQFWKFSWDEMASYDLPAIIDGILNWTNSKQLFYVGHDMGATIAFAMLASKPEYNKKIRAFLALAPIAYLDHTTSPLREIAAHIKDKEFMADLLKTEEFLTNPNILHTFSHVACRSPEKNLCASVFFLMYGYDITQLNKTRIPVYLHFTPAGTSLNTVLQFAQEIVTKKFEYYDFGSEENLLKYGQETPPEYNLKAVKVPVAVLSSESDKIANPQDVSRLTSQLPNLVLNYRVPSFTHFSHLDFVWGNNAHLQIYNKIIAIMKARP